MEDNVNVLEMLDKIADIENMIEAELAKAEELKSSVITDDQRAMIDAIDQSCNQTTVKLANELEMLKMDVKNCVLEAGKTIKSSKYQAVWNKPRVKWDADKLEGMIALIPAIAEARSFGEPSITFRRVK